MAKEWIGSFYRSKAWSDCRKAYIGERLRIDGGLCESCKKEPGYIVHHIQALTPDTFKDKEKVFGFSNLRYECKACHDVEPGHFKGQRKQCCRFGPNGEPIDSRKI